MSDIITEHTLPESVQIEQIRQILDLQMFGDVFQVKKWEYFTQWMQSEDVEEREKIHGKLLGLLDVQAEFEMISNRTLPEIELSGD